MTNAAAVFYVWTVPAAVDAAAAWATASAAYAKRYGSAPALVIARADTPAPDGVQVDRQAWALPRAWYMAAPAGAKGETG